MDSPGTLGGRLADEFSTHRYNPDSKAGPWPNKSRFSSNLVRKVAPAVQHRSRFIIQGQN